MLYLIHQSRLLQQILVDDGSLDDSIGCEVDVNVLPKPTGVVIPLGLGVSKSWTHHTCTYNFLKVGLEDLLSQGDVFGLAYVALLLVQVTNINSLRMQGCLKKKK